jgi:hypothetical protein
MTYRRKAKRLDGRIKSSTCPGKKMIAVFSLSVTCDTINIIPLICVSNQKKSQLKTVSESQLEKQHNLYK